VESATPTPTTAKPLYNKRMLHFFLRLFLLVTIWFVVYTLLLRPNRIIDRPLTNFITATVVKTVNFFSPSTPVISWAEDPVRPCAYLVQNKRNVFGIFDVCNGIDLMFIYVGIIVLLPYSAKRKLLFSIAGVAALIFANIIRICLLYIIYVYYRTAFDFSHHYLFTLLMYVLIFYGWLLFTKKGRIYEESR
jgi:exosortase/archaeosortase family protein